MISSNSWPSLSVLVPTLRPFFSLSKLSTLLSSLSCLAFWSTLDLNGMSSNISGLPELFASLPELLSP